MQNFLVNYFKEIEIIFCLFLENSDFLSFLSYDFFSSKKTQISFGARLSENLGSAINLLITSVVPKPGSSSRYSGKLFKIKTYVKSWSTGSSLDVGGGGGLVAAWTSGDLAPRQEGMSTPEED